MTGASAPDGLEEFLRREGLVGDPLTGGRAALDKAGGANGASRDSAWWLLAADALITRACVEVLDGRGDPEVTLTELVSEVSSVRR